MALNLSRPAAQAVRRGHPWVYRDGIVRPPRDLRSGASVELAGAEGEILGRGLWDAASPIAVRVFDLGGAARGKPLSTDDLGARALLAIARRDGRFGDDTTA